MNVNLNMLMVLEKVIASSKSWRPQKSRTSVMEIVMETGYITRDEGLELRDKEMNGWITQCCHPWSRGTSMTKKQLTE